MFINNFLKWNIKKVAEHCASLTVTRRDTQTGKSCDKKNHSIFILILISRNFTLHKLSDAISEFPLVGGIVGWR